MSAATSKIIEKAQAAMERAGYREHKWTPALVIDHLLDRAEKAEVELAEAKRQKDNCGGENCMGYRLDGAANWVREELLLEAEAVLTAESLFRAQGRHVPDVEWLAYPAVRRAMERWKK